MKKKRFLYLISILLIIGVAIFILKKSNTVSYNNENHHLRNTYDYGVLWFQYGGTYQTEKLYKDNLQIDTYYSKIWVSQGMQSRWVQLDKSWWGYAAKDIDSTNISFENCIEMEPIELINKWDAFQYLYRD